MKHYDAIIVVEGTTDKAFLSAFIDAEFVLTNGSDVPQRTIDYLKEALKTRDIIVLTDPDSPGKRIRDILDQQIPDLKHAYVEKAKCIKHHKVGVAESNQTEVLRALDCIIPSKNAPKKGNLTANDLFELGLIGGNDSSKLREKVELKLNLGHTNGKSLLQRANALGLTRKDLERAVHE